MSFAEELFNLRSPNATMVQVANAIDGLASGRKSNVVFSNSGLETVDSENVIFINNLTDITRTLPAPSTCEGKIFIYVKISNNSNTCTISAASGSIFGDYSNVLSARSHYVAYVSNGANYFQLLGSHLNWISWTPTISVVAPFTISSITSNGFYAKEGLKVHVRLRFSATLGGTVASTIQVTTPVDPNIGNLGLEAILPCQIVNTGSRLGYGVTQGAVTPRRFDVRRVDGSSHVLGSFSCSLSGYYIALN